MTGTETAGLDQPNVMVAVETSPLFGDKSYSYFYPDGPADARVFRDHHGARPLHTDRWPWPEWENDMDLSTAKYARTVLERSFVGTVVLVCVRCGGCVPTVEDEDAEGTPRRVHDAFHAALNGVEESTDAC